MKIFQIVDDECRWETPYTNMGEVVDKYPSDCLFVEAPDFVFEGWGYRTEDDNGNVIFGINRFIKPIPSEGYAYDPYTGKCIPESEFVTVLERAQLERQDENKKLFAEFLKNHPLLYNDGKYYGVTLEDQTEISLNINQYQLQIASGFENPILEWHSIHEGCKPWSIQDLTTLAATISSYIYPWFRKMQEYKTRIFATTSIDEINSIELIYKTEEELNNDEINE